MSGRAWAGVVVGFVLAGALAPTARAAAVPACTPAAGSTPTLATFTLVEGQSAELHLGRAEEGETELEFNVAGCRFARRTTLAADTRLFRKDAGSLERANVEVVAYGIGDEAVVSLRVVRGSAGPGSYRGAIVLEPESRLGQKVRVPVLVTLKYKDLGRLATFAFLTTFLLGTLTVFLKGVATGATNSFFQSPWRWKGLLLDLTAVTAGLTAAVAVFKSEYLNNPTWGAGDPFWDGVDLVVLMLAAYIAAATALTIGTDAARRL